MKLQLIKNELDILKKLKENIGSLTEAKFTNKSHVASFDHENNSPKVADLYGWLPILVPETGLTYSRLKSAKGMMAVKTSLHSFFKGICKIDKMVYKNDGDIISDFSKILDFIFSMKSDKEFMSYDNQFVQYLLDVYTENIGLLPYHNTKSKMYHNFHHIYGEDRGVSLQQATNRLLVGCITIENSVNNYYRYSKRFSSEDLIYAIKTSYNPEIDLESNIVTLREKLRDMIDDRENFIFELNSLLTGNS